MSQTTVTWTIRDTDDERWVDITISEGYQARSGAHVVTWALAQDDLALPAMILRETAQQAYNAWNTHPMQDWRDLTVCWPDGTDEPLPDWACAWVENPAVNPLAEIAADAARAAVAYVEEFGEPATPTSGDWDATWWSDTDVPAWVIEAYEAHHGTGSAFQKFLTLFQGFSESVKAEN